MSMLVFYIFMALVIMGLGLFLLRSLVKATFLAIIVVVIFRIGWVYSADDMINKFHLDKILAPDYIEEFQEGYGKYEDKRKEDELIDTEEMDNILKKELEEKLNKLKK